MVGVSAVAGAAPDDAARGNKPPKPDKTVEVQILGLNDFHGALEPIPETSSGGRIGATPAGGAAYLATHVDALRATNPKNTIFVSAGDLIGATPLCRRCSTTSRRSRPSTSWGSTTTASGTTSSTKASTELLRMQHGGCHPVDGCQDGDRFKGAKFDFLAANVKYEETGKTIFPPYKIHSSRVGSRPRSSA